MDELLSRRGLRTPFIRVAKDGAVVPAERFTRSGGAGAQVADQVADDRLLDLFADGHTVVLQGLHRLWPPLIDFAGAAGGRSRPPGAGQRLHHPPLVAGLLRALRRPRRVRAAGGRREAVAHPRAGAPRPLRDQPWTDHRGRGRGARAGGRRSSTRCCAPATRSTCRAATCTRPRRSARSSCHLTVGVHPVTRYAVLEALLDVVSDEPLLRASLPLGVDVADPADLEADLQATVEALVARLGAVTAADVADRLARRGLGSARPAPIGPLAQAADLGALSA